MADITEELRKFKEAVHGEDVRDAFVSAFTKINTSTMVDDVTFDEEEAKLFLTSAGEKVGEGAIIPTGGGGGADAAGFYPTLNDLLEDPDIEPLSVAQTAGFYTAGDGGGATYKILSSGVADGVFVHALENGYFAKLAVVDGFINVKQAGAKGNGSADDTDVLQTVMADEHCTTIYFPEGTYIVTPKIPAGNVSAPDRIIKLAKTALHINRDNVTVCGDGAEKSVIKLADGITDRYRSIIVVHKADNVTIRDISIDQNPSGSRLLPEPGSAINLNDPDEADGGDHYRDLYKLNCIATSGAMENLRIANCSFRHNGSQAIMANSNITNLVVENNTFYFDPSANHPGGTSPSALYYPRSSGPEYDNSTIYLNGQNAVVRGNRMFSECGMTPVDTYCLYNGSAHTDSENFDDTAPTGQVFLRARTAIENHASGVIISDNYAENYSTGVIVAQDTDDIANSVVSNNTFTDVCSGVAFWWKIHTELTPPVPFVNPSVTVRGNRITQTMKWYDNSVKNPSKYCHAFQCATAGVLKDIDISGNTVIFDRDSMTQDAERYGLESSACFASAKAVEIDGLVIADNVFLDLPVYGVYLHTSSGSTNVTGAIIRNNLFRNCGWCDKLNAALKDGALKNVVTRRAAIEISPTTLTGCEIFDNDIVDASTGGECGEAIIISDSAWVDSGAVTLKNNRIRSLSGAGFSIGSTAPSSGMDSIIDGTSQFSRFNVVDDEPTDIVAQQGQIFTNGVRTWKCTRRGSVGRSININTANMEVIQRQDSTTYFTTILTAATEAHGLRVGDTIRVVYNGVTNHMTVLLVNGKTIYTTDWGKVSISPAVSVSVAIDYETIDGVDRDIGVIEEIPLGTQYEAGVGIRIRDGVISVAELAETFAIPATIPVEIPAIDRYMVNGATTVVNGDFVHADGSITVGNQTIVLPELKAYEQIEAQATGAANIMSNNSGELALDDPLIPWEWEWSENGTNDDSVYFISRYNLPDAEDHTDGDYTSDLICNALPFVRLKTLNPISKTYTQHGITVGGANQVRVRLTKAEMIASGVDPANVTDVENGLMVWCAAVDAKIIYRVKTATATSDTVDALTTHTGIVTLTGGYPDGTMTGIGQQSQLDALTDRVVAVENAVSGVETLLAAL